MSNHAQVPQAPVSGGVAQPQEPPPEPPLDVEADEDLIDFDDETSDDSDLDDSDLPYPDSAGLRGSALSYSDVFVSTEQANGDEIGRHLEQNTRRRLYHPQDELGKSEADFELTLKES